MAKRRKKQVTKVAVGYVRVSTAGQAEDGISLDAQRAKVRAYCDLHGLTLLDVHGDEISGKRADNRPGLNAALVQACKHKAAVVVYSLSRLARSTTDAIAIAERLDNAGADLVSLSEQLDTTTAAGRMFFKLMAVLADFERDLVSERTTTALAHKRNRSERISGRIPFGYELADDGVRLLPNSNEQRAIRSMIGLRDRGQSYRVIIADLERRGVAPKNGGKWHAKVVRDIIEREAA